ncbi:unnamed protein product [Dicrocoelium dendriticum]|nr:unnamed protein product [Dicrocoelium dendriticum]
MFYLYLEQQDHKSVIKCCEYSRLGIIVHRKPGFTLMLRIYLWNLTDLILFVLTANVPRGTEVAALSFTCILRNAPRLKAFFNTARSASAI